jgi:hypothetical protein
MDIFEKNQKETEEKMKKYELGALKQMGIGLWAAASVFTAVNAFNDGRAFYVVTGIISAAGAIAFAIVAYRKKLW